MTHTSSLIAGLMALLLFAQSPVAEERRIEVKLGSVPMTVVVPGAYCPTDTSNAKDASWLAAQKHLLPKKQTLLAYFANCDQLKALRAGTRKALDDVITAAVVTALANHEIPVPRGRMTAQMADAFRRQSVPLLGGEPKAINRQVQKVAASLGDNESATFGILRQDANAVYVGFLQKRKSPDGATFLAVRVVSTTLVRKRLVTFAISAANNDANAIRHALATARLVVDRTIAANEK